MTENGERIEGLLLAILLQLMRGVNQGEKIHLLNVAGLSNLEIADMVKTTPDVVASTIYALRKKPKRKKSSGKKK